MKGPFGFKLALITGASSGLGRVTAMELAKKKVPMMLTGRNQDQLSSLASYIRNFIDVSFLPADLSQEEGRAKVTSYIQENSPDLIINNAGIGLYGDALEHPIDEQMNIAKLNTLAPLQICLEGAKALQKREQKGIILNVSSVAGFYSLPSMSVYAASKAFITNFSKSFDVEMKPYGIRIFVSCPGSIHTNFASRAASQTQDYMPKVQMLKEVAAQQLLWQIEKRKPVHIFDWRYRVGAILSKLIPERWIAQKARSEVLSRKKTD